MHPALPIKNTYLIVNQSIELISLNHRGKDPHWRSLWRTVSHGRDPMLEQGKSVRSPAPEEEGAAETRCDGLIVTPIPRPLCRWGGR